ncbi:MAG: class I SAM-dependent methyltransferase [Flavobacteriales bacterium]|nr:class I SAM-dependent methyltransferase [Flavobacteriales bacterium]
MDFLPEEIDRYASEHTSAEPDYLQELNRETWQKVLVPRMLSGHFQGRLLSMISHMLKPSRILEIGTYTGYSALCLAEGLHENGLLFTIDINEELRPIQEKYIQKAGMDGKIRLLTGNAMEVVPRLNEAWDLVFIDADKENYIHYYNMVMASAKSGTHLLLDNVLWSGKVVHEAAKKDEETRVLKELNKLINNDPRVENILLPIRDGLTLVRVK